MKILSTVTLYLLASSFIELGSLAANAQVTLESLGLEQRTLNELNVTQGKLTETGSGFLTTTDSRTRAVERTGAATEAQLTFRYRGHSDFDEPLGSGIFRRQIGLKLRAANSCNLLYVMWRIEPTEELVVSLKSNPGQVSDDDCGNGGYTNLRPDVVVTFPPRTSARDNATHRLMARLTPVGNGAFQLLVFADMQEVWRKTINNLPQEIAGPAGFRTDNGSFIFKFYTKH